MKNIKDLNINLHSFIFTKKVNNHYKLMPFNVSYNDIGETQYLSPVAKEWRNHVYNYNYHNSINYPIYDININELIKGYFSLYFNNNLLKYKYISRKKKYQSFHRIFVSKAEIKHTNNKAIITIYIFNKEISPLKRKLRKLIKNYKNLYFLWLKLLKNTNYNTTQTINSNFESDFSPKSFYKVLFNFLGEIQEDKKNLYFNSLNSNSKFRWSKHIINQCKSLFLKIRRLKLKINLNKYKVENRFLFKLSGLLSKYYNKKVEFNIVNLKSLAYNNDIFTEVLTLKLKKEGSNPIHRMNSLLARVVLPKVNPVIERGRIEKQVDSNFLPNKYKNLNISNIIDENLNSSSISKDNFNTLLQENFYNYPLLKLENNTNNILSKLISPEESTLSYFKKIREIIFNSLKYKYLGGAKLMVKGRLTKRYRADRALYKSKWKGGLKNIDSAFKGLPTVVFRGHLDSNVEKSKFWSKRRIGSFGVRSWIAGK